MKEKLMRNKCDPVAKDEIRAYIESSVEIQLASSTLQLAGLRK